MSPRGSRGTVYRPRMVHEHLLIGIREMSTDVVGQRSRERHHSAAIPGRHSQKPDKFYSIIERVVPGPNWNSLVERNAKAGPSSAIRFHHGSQPSSWLS